MAGKDVSKQTVAVLVFLAILVSLLGTLTVMQELGNYRNGGVAPVDTSDSRTQGRIILKINNPDYPITDSTTGEIKLMIASPDGG